MERVGGPTGRSMSVKGGCETFAKGAKRVGVYPHPDVDAVLFDPIALGAVASATASPSTRAAAGHYQ